MIAVKKGPTNRPTKSPEKKPSPEHTKEQPGDSHLFAISHQFFSGKTAVFFVSDSSRKISGPIKGAAEFLLFSELVFAFEIVASIFTAFLCGFTQKKKRVSSVPEGHSPFWSPL